MSNTLLEFVDLIFQTLQRKLRRNFMIYKKELFRSYIEAVI